MDDERAGEPAGPERGRSSLAAPGASGRRRRATLSLLHLSIALLGLALAAALVIPAWFARPAVTLDRAAVLLAEDLREAQNRAAYRHRRIDVCFLAGGDGYEVRGEDGRPLDARIGSGPFRRQYSRDAVFRGVRIEIAEGASGGTLAYDRLGFVDEGARFVLRFRGEARTLTLEARTGEIAIDGLREPWTDSGD